MGSFKRLSLSCLLIVAAFTCCQAADLPEPIMRIIAAHRADGAKGWAYTQTTVGEGRRSVERFNPRMPESQRWTLLERDNRPATEEEKNAYLDQKRRRVNVQQPPAIKDQLDLSSADLVGETSESWRYRFKIKPGNADDKAAEFMRATLTIDKQSATITEFELSNTEPFSPSFFIKVHHTRSVMRYSPGSPEAPSHLLSVHAEVKARAMLRSVDQTIDVTYTDFEKVTGLSR